MVFPCELPKRRGTQQITLFRDKVLIFLEHQLNSDILYLLLYSSCVCFSWKELRTQFCCTWLLGTILRHRRNAGTHI